VTRVLVVNTAHFDNKGSRGRVEGMINCLEETIPQAQITLLHRYYRRDKDTVAKQLARDHSNLEIGEHPWFRGTDHLLLNTAQSLARFCLLMPWRASCGLLRRMGLPLKDSYQQYDVIVDLNLIEPDEGVYFAMAAGNFLALFDIWYAKMSGKPVVVCSATIGPYKSRLLRFLARYVLNKVNIVTLREECSQDYLQILGVNKPRIYTTADLAFLLEPADIQMVLEREGITPDDKPLVGIAPTAMMHPSLQQSQYIQLMAELSDFIIEHLGATIIYITHTYQDRPITDAIYQQVKNTHKARVIPDMSDSELKGIIGTCDMFISSRFHALVASTSSGIPSIGIVAYSPSKFHGIAGNMMGQENYLLDVDENFDHNAFLGELKAKINDLWTNRDTVEKNLRERSKLAKEQVLLNGKLIKELSEKYT